MSRKRKGDRSDRDRIAVKRRTSPCKTACLNMKRSGHASASAASSTAAALPSRKAHKFLPSHQQVMALLSKAVVPEERYEFERRFREVATSGDSELPAVTARICKTPLSWISWAYQCKYPMQLRHAGEMFPDSGTVSEFLDEFYVMDVILNRCPHGGDGIAPPPSEADGGEPEDHVRFVRSYKPEDMMSMNDHKFRAMILFLPQSGVFYCARERRDECVGMAKTLIPLDMSWLRLERREEAGGSVSYVFGAGSYVKRFYQLPVPRMTGPPCMISAWRISRRRIWDSRQIRHVHRVKQCSDGDGPMLPPDVFDGEDCASWPHPYLAAEYNRRLAHANSARKDGRHYAASCHHFRLPESCWIIDPNKVNNMDLVVDVADRVHFRNRQSVIMIRHGMPGILKSGSHQGDHDKIPKDTDEVDEALGIITHHNSVLRRRSSKGGARARGGDAGTMHAIGTLVDMDTVTTLPYAANSHVPEGLLRNMVVALSQIGRHFFPQVYAVIRDLESDAGVLPLPPMDGAGGSHVGCTVDMSVNLGNSSHYDVHDASQGYSVWTEEMQGLGANWFFILPNLHGTRPDGRPFAGVAIRLSHGVAISWDGRVIRHCTSLSMPDGIDGRRVGDGRYCFKNNLYGSFTAAKERIVQAGRLASATAVASRPVQRLLPIDFGDPSNGTCQNAGIPEAKARRRHRCRKKRRRSGKGRADADIATNAEGVNELAATAVVNTNAADAAGGVAVQECIVDNAGSVSIEDLEVGGRYRIPKKNREWWTY